MKTFLISITTNYTIRQKLNGVRFAQCNKTKRFVKIELAEKELKQKTKQPKIINVPKYKQKPIKKNKTVFNPINLMLVFICLLCAICFGACLTNLFTEILNNVENNQTLLFFFISMLALQFSLCYIGSLDDQIKNSA